VGAALPGRNSTTCSTQAWVIKLFFYLTYYIILYYIILYYIILYYIILYYILLSDMQKSTKIELYLVGAALPSRNSTTCSTTDMYIQTGAALPGRNSTTRKTIADNH
jgi:hypothetical protein